MAGATLSVLFGAAVRADGRPSQALARRIAYAARAAQAAPEALILCSGGVGRVGPSEASVMAAALAERGVPTGRLILDEESRDTLQSVIAAARLVRQSGARELIACSDGYHLPRIRLMLQALGIRSRPGPVRPGQGGVHRLYMALREAAAIPYDLGIILTRRRRLLAEIQAP